MKKKLFLFGKNFLLLGFLVASVFGWGQNNVFTYSNTTATIPTSFNLTNGDTTNPIDQTSYLLLDTKTGGTDYITTNNFDLSASTKATINVQVATYGSGTNPYLKVEFSTNGGTTWNATTYTSATPTSATYIAGGPIVITQTFSTTTKFRFSNGVSNGKGIRLQTFKLDVDGQYISAYTSTATGGDWNVASTWVQNVVPPAGSTVNIVGPVNINNSTGQVSNSGIININNNGVLKCGYTLGAALTGTGTVNLTGTGILSIEQGGWPGTTNTYNYGTTGTLQFNNNSGSYAVNSGDNWFPATIPNVNVLGAGGITVNSAHTVSTLLQTSAPITNANNLTVTGTLQVNSTAATMSNAINYGAASTLVYNVNATMGRGNEWNNSPANVTLQNNSLLNYPNGWGTFTRTITGNLTINSGSALYMDYANPGTGVGLLTVGGNMVLAGNLSLGNKPGGDLAVGGNWTNTGTAGNFVPKGRAVIFNGTGTQNITNTLGETFNFLIINKTAGSVKLANNVTVNGNTGSVLQLLNAGTLDLNGKSLTLSNNGGGILVDGAARTLTSTVPGATINVTGTKAVSATNGGSLIIAPNITTVLTSGIDFGAGGLTLVQGTLQIKPNGYVNTNAPKYASTSTLEYNGVTGYNVNTGWSAANGTIGTTPGFPQNVLISSSSLNLPTTDRGLAGNLTIGTGSTLNMNLTSGDLYAGGHWVNNGTFNPNERGVFFNGAAAQNLTGATTFDWLIMNNTVGGLNLQPSSPVTVNKGLTLTSGAIYIAGNNLTIPATATITGGSASSHIVTSNGGAGKLRRTGVGNTDVLFPLGISGVKYSPVTIKNTTGTSHLSINLNNSTFTGAVFDATQVVKMQWNITSSTASTAVVTPSWESGDQGSAMFNPGTGELGNYISPNYTLYSPVALTQFTTSANNVALQSGENYIVVGNTGGIYTAPPANDNCSGAVTLTVDAAAVNGTVFAATTSSATSCGSGAARKDVWYKFTTTDAGNYAITVVGSATFDAVIDVRSGDCTTNTNVACKDGTGIGGTELLNTYTFAANTTYFVRVFHYSATDPADKAFTIAVASPPPAITVSPATLTFADTNVNSNSASQTVSVAGYFLSPASGDLTVAAPSTDFEVSKDGTTWGSTATYSYTGRRLSASDLFIRFTPKSGCAKTGNVTVSGGGATTANIAVSGNGVIPAPTATAATNISDVGFTANWDAVSGATGYALDVSTSPTFTTNGNLTLTEGFESTTFPPTGWIRTGWTRSTTAADINTGSGAAIAGSQNGTLTTMAVSKPLTMKFYLGRSSNTTAKTLTIEVSTTSQTTGFTTVATYDHSNVPGSSYNQYTVDLSAYSNENTVYIRFNKASDTTSPWRLDDIEIIHTVTTPSFVPGYHNLPVTGTSQTVSGLSPDTDYYYRVRSGGACPSVNSNVIHVKTGKVVTWTGTAWDNTTGPTEKDKAVIAGIFDENSNGGSFISNNLTINSGVTFLLPSNLTATVVKNITNNGNVTVSSDAGLVQKKDDATFTGNPITVKRMSKLKRQEYTYWGSPVKNQNLYAFSPRTLTNRFYKYNEATDLFVNTGLSSASVFEDATGYAIRAPNYDSASNYNSNTVPVEQMFTFTGVPNAGDVTVALQHTDAAHGFNLVGNPYPSNIDFNQLLAGNSAVLGAAAYFWTNHYGNSNGAYQGNNYATYIDGEGAAPTSSMEKPTNIIKVGQGFIVKSLAPGNLVFKNSYRTSNTNGVFFNSKPGSLVQKDRYVLKLTTPLNVFNTITVVYKENSTNAFDVNTDAPLLIVGSDSFYSVVEDKKLIIQGRAYPLLVTDVVNLGVKMFQPGIHTISMVEKAGVFDSGQPIYLHDKVQGTYINLQNGDYTFTANVGTDESRFEIVYETGAVLGNDSMVKKDILVYRDGNTFVVKASENITQIQVYDTSGKLISVLKPNSAKAVYDAESTSSAVYVLKISTASGNIVTRKVVR